MLKWALITTALCLSLFSTGNPFAQEISAQEEIDSSAPNEEMYQPSSGSSSIYGGLMQGESETIGYVPSNTNNNIDDTDNIDDENSAESSNSENGEEQNGVNTNNNIKTGLDSIQNNGSSDGESAQNPPDIKALNEQIQKSPRTLKAANNLVDIVESDLSKMDENEANALKINALRKLEFIGQEGKAATPKLIDIMNNSENSSDVRDAAAKALESLGTKKGIEAANQYHGQTESELQDSPEETPSLGINVPEASDEESSENPSPQPSAEPGEEPSEEPVEENTDELN